jgi:acyl-CoA thioester hydrolase
LTGIFSLTNSSWSSTGTQDCQESNAMPNIGTGTLEYVEMTKVYRHDIMVSKEVIDDNDHVNNVAYVQWMQDAASCHSDSAGCARATRDAGAAWVARTHFIEYLRPAVEGDRIAVLTWVSNFRRATSLRKYKFMRIADGTVLSRGETDWVFVDANTGRPRNIPENIRSTFDVVLEDQEP